MAVAEARYDHTPLAYLEPIFSGAAADKTDSCCHDTADDVCHLLSSRSTFALSTQKQPALDPPPAVNLVYTDSMPDRLLCETGMIFGPDFPRAIVTAPIYLTTLRLRL